MAIGDEALAAGYLKVPDDGEEGRVRHGAREINRTRDYIAQVGARVPADPSAMRAMVGISMGTAEPSGGSNGDVYFKVV